MPNMIAEPVVQERNRLPKHWFEPVVLSGTYVTLEPLSPKHHNDLVEATKDGELWKLWYTAVPSPEKMAADIERRIAEYEAGTMLPFAVIDKRTGTCVGMTTFMNIDAPNRRAEIGSTWYRASAQRTPINTEAKLLLLEHAFETQHCIAVEFRTSFHNQRSRAAIERIGAHLDGVLRNHKILEGGIYRDSCVYSIIESEWPATKKHLTSLLTRPR